MQFLVRVFGGIDIISGKLSYELQALDPETGAILSLSKLNDENKISSHVL